MRRLILAAAAVASLAGCADMTPTQQRALSGTAIGASGGAIIGAIAGNAGLGAGIGAAAGLAGGLIYNQVKQGQASSYQAGYQAGASRRTRHNRMPPSGAAAFRGLLNRVPRCRPASRRHPVHCIRIGCLEAGEFFPVQLVG
jgi:hypothetical protein